MTTIRGNAEARRRADRSHRALGEDVRRLREDAAMSRTQLAEAAGIDLAYLCRIEDIGARPTIDTYTRIATALGADLSLRLYPNTGPGIHDRHQARILEAMLGQVHARWRGHPEVNVRTPVRGSIDLLLHAEREGEVVAVEIESDLRRIEQVIRWSAEKAGALPSWPGWSRLGETEDVSRLLVVRSTRRTRQLGREFAGQLAAAYPAHPADALAALTGTTRWPGPALIWADLEPNRVRFVTRR